MFDTRAVAAGVLILSIMLSTVHAINNGVARLPVMGYNTWNAYQCAIDEALVLKTAEQMKSLGFQAAGYNYINIDDCYSEKKRSASGDIVEDKVRFAGGMKKLNKQIHALGFKTGIYSSAGWYTCAGYPGSYDNEYRDALTFHNWGFDYLKYDNCAIPFDDITRTGNMGRFQRMADALEKLSKKRGCEDPFVFSICQWGLNQVWLWGAELGHSWRTTGDIWPNWDSLAGIINFNSFITQATDFYGRNDLDMLQVGNGDLTYDEAKSHFTAWALMRSPLLIGTDLSNIRPEIVEILTNQEIIAINQDPVIGKSISPFQYGPTPTGYYPDFSNNKTHPAQYWSGPTQNGTVFMLLNTLNELATMSFNLTRSPWIRAGRQYSVRDLWTHTDNGTVVRTFVAPNVPAHGVVALLLRDAGNEPDGLFPCLWWQCTDRNGTLVGTGMG